MIKKELLEKIKIDNELNDIYNIFNNNKKRKRKNDTKKVKNIKNIFTFNQINCIVNEDSKKIVNLLNNNKKIKLNTNKIIENEQKSIESIKINEEILKSKFCYNCGIKEKEILFIPCKHTSSCYKCSLKLKKCPFCGKNIEKKVCGLYLKLN